MPNGSQRKMYQFVGAAGLLVLVAMGWHVAETKSSRVSAGDTALHDPIATVDLQAPSRAAARSPLASIPWKRDGDTFAAVFVEPAGLPWLRESNLPDAVALQAAALPWFRLMSGQPARWGETASIRGQREGATGDRQLCAYAVIFLPTGELPWQY